jgi:hypothetical protein
MSLSRGQLKCKKGRMMRTSTPSIHPQLHLANIAWSYYSCPWPSAQPSGEFVLEFLFTLFRPWKPVHFFCSGITERNHKETLFARGEFGLQNSTNLWLSPRLHTESDLDALALHGKPIKSTSQRMQPQPHITSESSAAVDLLQTISVHRCCDVYS